MFYLPVVTDSPIFANAARRLRNLKVFIPVVIAVIAYTVIIANIIATQGRPKSHEAPTTTLPPGGQDGGTPLPTQTQAPVGTDTPATTQAPGSTSAPGTAGPSTTAGPTTTRAPGASTSAPTTTKAPTAGPTTTTKAPTGAPATTKAPTAAPNVTTIKPPTTTPQPTVVTTTPSPTPSGPYDYEEPRKPPSELGGKRGFCFRNSCTQTIWVGQIGGSTGVSCAGGCPGGTICNGVDETLGCYFSLPFPENKIKLLPGQLFCLPFDFDPVTTTIHMPDGDIHLVVQWSGAIYGSTGCDADMNCESGICKNCKSYQGPVGPVSQGELTLSAIWKDYYDTTLIHGANVPLAVKPMSYKTKYYPDEWAPIGYHCTAPGLHTQQGMGGAANWKFNTTPSGHLPHQDAVPLVTGGSGKSCNALYDCPTGEICGARMQLTSDNLPMSSVDYPVCGRGIGIWTRSELCGWNDAAPFANCKDVPDPASGSGTMMELYKCAGPNAASCFQPKVDQRCCGCTVWEDFVPVHGEPCKNHNPVWEKYVMPHLEEIKRACPMCYTYPYDDSTALYTCWDDPYENYVSYEFEWCPGGSTLTYSQ